MQKFLIIIFICTACNNSSSDTVPERKDGYTVILKTKEDSLFHEVMEGHNIGMARMGKIKGYISNVQQSMDSIKNLTPSLRSNAADYSDVLESLLKELQNAESGMNVWMDEFNIDSAKENLDKRLQYLEDEKERVNKVRDDILNSIRKVDSLLK